MTTTQITSDLSISTAEHPHAATIRESFAAFDRGDLDTVRASMTDDCVWTNYGSGPTAGRHQGWDAIEAMFVQLFTLTEGTFKTIPTAIFADDQRSVALYDTTITLDGETTTLPWVIVDHYNADGKATSVDCFCYDQARADALLNDRIPQQR